MKVTILPIIISAPGTVTKGLVHELEDLEITGQMETVSKNNIVEIGQNTERSPGDLKRLAVFQIPVENHQLTQV